MSGESGAAAVDGGSARTSGRVGVRLLAVIVGAVSAVMYWPFAFGVWRPYDDEGAMLVLFRSFAERGGLYRTTYNNYGPFPFAFWWTMLRPFGFAYNNLTVGRLLALAMFAVSAALTVLIASRFAGRTASVLIGVVVAELLTVNFNEPFHPGALIGVMLLAVVWVQISVKNEWVKQFISGLIFGALVFSKINLGVFAMAAWFGWWVFTNVDGSKRTLRRGLAVLLTVFPLVVVGSGTTQWRTLFMAAATAVSIGLTCFAWFGHERSGPTAEPSSRRSVLWFAGGGAVAAAFSLAVVTSRGSSLSDVYSGMIGRAVRQRDIFSLFVFADSVRVGLLVLSSALTFVCISRSRRWHRSGASPQRWELMLLVFLELVGGGELLLVRSYGLSLLPVLALLVTRPPSLGGEPRGVAPAQPANRLLLLVFLALFQVLHAYPVAGSQMGWAMLLATLLGGVVATRGARHALLLARQLEVTTLLTRTASLIVAGIAVIAVVGYAQASESKWREYQSSVALDENHARFVRLDAETVTNLRSIAATVRERCTAYYSLPGLGTFSVLTQLPQPTGFNATVWPLLFDDADQQQVIGDLQRVDRLCVVRNDRLLKGWMQGRPVPPGPLLDYLYRFDTKVASAGNYAVYTRKP